VAKRCYATYGSTVTVQTEKLNGNIKKLNGSILYFRARNYIEKKDTLGESGEFFFWYLGAQCPFGSNLRLSQVAARKRARRERGRPLAVANGGLPFASVRTVEV